jgi:hypothetical protein
MARKIKNDKIEIGDFVMIVKGVDNGWPKNEGFVGILDNEFVKDGITQYAVVSENYENDDIFYYAAEIKLFQKA